jgi:hypothetical protein
LWGIDKTGDPSSGYKSTLVVPIKVPRSPSEMDDRLNETDRLVIAFLCIDHIDENYFDPRSDLEVAGASAALLATYLATRKAILINARYLEKILKRLSAMHTTLRIESQDRTKRIDPKAIGNFGELDEVESEPIALIDLILLTQERLD